MAREKALSFVSGGIPEVSDSCLSDFDPLWHEVAALERSKSVDYAEHERLQVQWRRYHLTVKLRCVFLNLMLFFLSGLSSHHAISANR